MEGRRERKKRQTRDRIQETALELFTTHGYRSTTIAAIAEEADVATRTVTLHFPTKEDLLFADDPFTPETLGERLATRDPSEPTLDVVRAWMRDTMQTLDRRDADEQRAPGQIWARRTRRAALIIEDDDLRAHARSAYYELERLIATSIAADLDQPADALAPRLTAYTVVGGLRELYMTYDVHHDVHHDDTGTEELFTLIDRVLDFARAGLSRLS